MNLIDEAAVPVNKTNFIILLKIVRQCRIISGMIFIETTLFTRLIVDLLSDEEYLYIQKYLLHHPDAGKKIPGSGGVRKLRWRNADKGKRGGVRIIYYWKETFDEIWMLTIYQKGKQDNIPAHILKKIAKEVKNV